MAITVRTLFGLAALCLCGLSCSRGALEVDKLPPCPENCDDGVFCNGIETCDMDTRKCVPADELFSCDDDEECTIDRCDETVDRCDHQPQPRDLDLDGFDACDDDCDDENAQVHPGATELCNMIDDNCDRIVDEALISECGDCRPGCRLLDLPTDDVRLPMGQTGWVLNDDNASSVGLNPDGSLILNSESTDVFFAWIANNADGKVTKLDTRDGTQVGLYDSVLLGSATHPQPARNRCDGDDSGNNSGNCPSRTAVDLNGAVYIANRAFGHQGTITKIAGFRDDCIDRNNDGVIQTSEDVNLNGRIDRSVAGEYRGQADECILWTVDVGSSGGGVPRALAVAADGTVWVGLHHDQSVVQLDPTDGHPLRSPITLPSFKPYGAAFDRENHLWMTEALTGQILWIDTDSGNIGSVVTAPAIETGCPSSYGIAVDPSNRVWIAGFTCPYAFGFDVNSRTWLSVKLPGAGVTRGIAARDDGLIFVAASHAWINVDFDASNPLSASDPITRLTVFNGRDGSNVRVFGTPQEPILGSGSIGVGLDSDGRAWLVNQDTESATRVNIDTGEVVRFPAGPEPYTYSDFTGYALRRITAPTGYVRSILEGCAMGPSEWERLTWDATVPSSARLEIRLRTAATRAALDTAMWLGPWGASPIDLLTAPGPLPDERFLEIESRLISINEMSSPTLSSLTVQVHCPL